MARIRCKYHPDRPARWHCSACGIDLCASCVKPAGAGEAAPTCHACKAQVSSLGVGNTIPAFWERIPRFFLYPAKTDALFYVGGLSVLALFAVVPLAGILVYLVISYALLKYGYVVLDHTARGNLEPPPLMGADRGTDGSLPIKQLVVFIVMAVVVSVAMTLTGTVLGLLVLLVVLFSVPASVMSMALDGSIGRALNPAGLGPIIMRIGLPYLILYVFLLLLMAGSSFLQSVLALMLPPSLVLVATTFVSGYFTVIMFNMMGYVVYQYHEELGFEGVKEFADEADTKGAARSSPREDPFETEIGIMVNEGRIDEAKERLRARLRGYGGSSADRERYHKLLQLSGDRAESTSNGRELVQALLAQSEDARAVSVYGECLALDPGFALADGAPTHRLAEVAHDLGKGKLALRMLSGFAQRFPRYGKIPEAYLLAARLLCEQEGDDRKALQVLDALLQRYPGHPLEGEIEEYRELVRKISGGTSAPTATR